MVTQSKKQGEYSSSYATSSVKPFLILMEVIKIFTSMEQEHDPVLTGDGI